jgi:hypothetical protein
VQEEGIWIKERKKEKKTKRKRYTKKKVAGSPETSTHLCVSVRYHISENCFPSEVVQGAYKLSEDFVTA